MADLTTSARNNVNRLRAAGLLFFFFLGGIPGLICGAALWFISDIGDVWNKSRKNQYSRWVSGSGIFGITAAAAGLIMLGIVSWFFPPLAFIGLMTLGAAALWVSLTMAGGSKSPAEVLANLGTTVLLAGVFLLITMAFFATLASGFGTLALCLMIVGAVMYSGGNIKISSDQGTTLERAKGIFGYLTLACVLIGLATSFVPPVSVVFWTITFSVLLPTYAILWLVSWFTKPEAVEDFGASEIHAPKTFRQGGYAVGQREYVQYDNAPDHSPAPSSPAVRSRSDSDASNVELQHEGQQQEEQPGEGYSVPPPGN